ncbi:MAG: substrate-binding domain-containing protein [Magnetococcales bacterium]|nr:substrate-binding domain-containing protein [Magnetococcales bacterium]
MNVSFRDIDVKIANHACRLWRERHGAIVRVANGWFLVLALGLMAVWIHATADAAVNSVNRIRIKGSNAMIGVVNDWTKVYQEGNPGVFFEVNGGGSGNGIAALINGHVDVAVTTRSLKNREIRLIEQRSGAPPKEFVIGNDALSIIVNKANPLNGITLNQLGRLFGRDDGFSGWNDLGVSVPGCSDNAIVRMSRKNNSGDYIYFRETMFHERNHFHPGLITIRENDRLLEKIANSPCGIGFTSMATVTVAVKTLCIARDEKKETECFPPTAHFTIRGLYPLARPLYFYILDKQIPLLQPFIEWVQGVGGQEILRKAGFISIPKAPSEAKKIDTPQKGSPDVSEPVKVLANGHQDKETGAAREAPERP